MRLFAAALISVATMTLSFAATFNVSNTIELRKALKMASINNESDTIILAAGIYRTDIDNGGAFEYSQSSFDLTIKSQIPRAAIIEAALAGRAFNLKGGGTITLDGLVVQNGWVDNGSGAAIYSETSLNILNCKFASNSINSKTNAYGGAIYQKGAQLTVNASDFSANSATHAGGAIYADGAELNIANSVFENNKATNGGAVYLYNQNNIGFAIFNSTFIVTSAASGAVNGFGVMANNIFYNNGGTDISFSERSALLNSYVDFDKIEGIQQLDATSKNNVLPLTGPLNMGSNNYKITSGSVLIGKGMGYQTSDFRALFDNDKRFVLMAGMLKNDKYFNVRNGYICDIGHYDSGTATSKPLTLPVGSDCNQKVFAQINKPNQWYLLGTSDDGCSISSLKALGAQYIMPFNGDTNSYDFTDSIKPYSGFWIRR